MAKNEKYGYEMAESTETLKGTGKLIKELQELKALQKALDDRIKNIQNEVTEKMTERNLTTIKAAGYKVTLLERHNPNKFNSKKFSEECPELYAKYVEAPKQPITMAFTVTAETGKAKAATTTEVFEAVRAVINAKNIVTT